MKRLIALVLLALAGCAHEPYPDCARGYFIYFVRGAMVVQCIPAECAGRYCG